MSEDISESNAADELEVESDYGVTSNKLVGYSNKNNCVALYKDSSIHIDVADSLEQIYSLPGSGNSPKAVFSPNGNYIAVGFRDRLDRTIYLWDTKSGDLLNLLSGHTAKVWSIEFSHDGNFLACGATNGALRIWNTESGELIQTLVGDRDKRTKPKRIEALAFSHDGNYLAADGGDDTLRIWDVKTGYLFRTLMGDTNKNIHGVAFSKNDEYLATGNGEGTLCIWDTKSGKLLHEIPGHNHMAIVSIDFSQNGNYMVSGGWDGLVCVRNVNSGELIQTVDIRHSHVFSVTFDEDNSSIVVASYQNEIGIWDIKFWDVKTGELLRTLPDETPVENTYDISAWIFQISAEKTLEIQELNTDGEFLAKVNRYEEDIRLGDKVYIYRYGRDDGIICRGEISSDLIESESPNETKKVKIKIISNLKDSVLPEQLLKEDPITQALGSRMSNWGIIFAVSSDEVLEMERMISDETSMVLAAADSYSKASFLDEVFMDEKKYNELCEILFRKKNLILQGPPGVGKTFAAIRLAYSIIGKQDKSNVELVQFHQSYSYEDFVMGYRPDADGFKLVEGPFYSMCKIARDNPYDKYFFIIDEINRGNLSKIFGELLMLIESDKREARYATRLIYRDEQFYVPDNVYILGLMNTADRSLAMIDYALRRRFAFVDIEPAFDSIGFKREQEKIQSKLFDSLIEEIKRLNIAISADRSLGNGFQIGHSYFLGINGVMTQENKTEAIKSVVEYELKPLIEEYWFDDKLSCQEWINKLKKSIT